MLVRFMSTFFFQGRYYQSGEAADLTDKEVDLVRANGGAMEVVAHAPRVEDDPDEDTQDNPPEPESEEPGSTPEY